MLRVQNVVPTEFAVENFDRKLTFAAAKMGAEIIPGLLGSVCMTTTNRREYCLNNEAKKGPAK